MSEATATNEQYERAARKICELRGISPNETIWDSPSPAFPFGTPVSRQFLIEKELKNLVMMLEVLDKVIEDDDIASMDEVETL